MLDRVEETLKMNRIEHNRSGYSIQFKFGGLSSRIRIQYNPNDDFCSLESGETALAISSCLIFLGASLVLISNSGFLGLISACLLVSAALSNALILLVTQIKLLDLKSQLRSSGIYL
ncbi:hypothetical protein NM06_02805 [Vibrio sinaloensis]|uniref:Uncharacterized protein n=1 Tax=Photobacterium sp. (strain ATCC 43367) TaxID=379097 RepID=A0A0A5I270_PHOS4|nr:hypothetical protein NM06_02805 [Vibrio sinaloensis]